VFDTGGQGAASSLQVAGANRPAENVLMVYACLVTRRDAVGGVPVRISDGNDNIIESGPAVDLLARPNSAMTWDQYVRVLETYLTLYNSIGIDLILSSFNRQEDRPPGDIDRNIIRIRKVQLNPKVISSE
jgi:hypothetical protein